MVKKITKIAIVALVLTGAFFIVRSLYHFYMITPWTRDGRVRTDVVEISPFLTNKIDSLYVRENQYVKAGDTLFTQEIEDYQIALRDEKATLSLLWIKAQRAKGDYERRASMNHRGVSAEEVFDMKFAYEEAKASYNKQKIVVDKAKLELDRIATVAPCDGYITNISKFKGDIVSHSSRVMSLVDLEKTYIYGYFLETQIQNIKPNSEVKIELMAYPDRTFTGHVQQIARGISDYSNASDDGGLHKVTPTFEWVRLAQRIPVMITIDEIPEDMKITVGMTATLIIDSQDTEDSFFLKINLDDFLE